MTGAAPKPPGLHAELQRGDRRHRVPSRSTGSPRRRSSWSPRRATRTRSSRPRRAARCPGVELLRRRRRRARLRARRGRRDPRPRGRRLLTATSTPARDAEAFDARRLLPHRRPRHASTPTVTSRSPDGSRTSSSARARTSRPRRSRTCCTRTRRSPRWRSSGWPTPVLGERCCAVVLPVAGRRRSDARRARRTVRRRPVSRSQKWPEQLEVVTDFPRNASGKVLKYRLQRPLLERPRDGRLVQPPAGPRDRRARSCSRRRSATDALAQRLACALPRRSG